MEKIEKFFYDKDINWHPIVKKILILGSLTSYQYNRKSDLDVHLRIDLPVLQEQLKEQGINIYKEERAARLLDKIWRKEINIAQEKGINTEHPFEFYFEIEGFTGAAQVDGVYNLLKNEWEKEPRTVNVDYDVDEIYPQVIEEAENILREFDIELGEVQRGIQDIELLQETIGKFDTEKKSMFRKKLEDKLTEIENSIIGVVEKGREVLDERRQEYRPESDANIKFKYLQRYGYLWLIKQLEKSLKNIQEEIEVNDEADIEKVKDVVEDFCREKKQITSAKDLIVKRVSFKLSEIIAEEKKVFENGLIQTSSIPKELENIVRYIQMHIPGEKLTGYADERGWVEDGIQSLLHITILFGVQENVGNEVAEIYGKYKPIEIRTGDIKYFDVPERDYSVAYLEIESEKLRKFHNELKDNIENKHYDEYGKFEPHITIAYLKLNERIEKVPFKGIKWQIEDIELVNTKGQMEKIALNLPTYVWKKHKTYAAIKRKIAKHNCIINKEASPAKFQVLVDFDGVIADESNGFQGAGIFGEPLPLVKESLRTMRDNGIEIIIYTCRGEEDLVGDYLNEHEIPFDFINENPRQPDGLSDVKLYGDLYIDNRAEKFTEWSEDFMNKVLDKKDEWEMTEKKVSENIEMDDVVDTGHGTMIDMDPGIRVKPENIERKSPRLPEEKVEWLDKILVGYRMEDIWKM